MEIIKKNQEKRPKIAVFGDCMIDEYHKVQVKRISPEAPIPVMLSKSDAPDYVLPGGASNVVCQLRHWNVDCVLFGLMSSVDAAIFERNGIVLPQHYAGELLTKRVPRKIRFQDHQSLIRWDIEDDNYGEEITSKIDHLILCLEYYLINEGGFDAVILSDYGKGVFKDFRKTQHLITLCHAHGIPTIVDPKNPPVEKWTGCTYFKPNAIEAEGFTGVKIPDHQWQKLAEKLPESNIVVTYGDKGVGGLSFDGQSFFYESNKKVSARNFSGAGDCFAAFFTLAIAHGLSLEKAVETAYKAGEVYVQKEYNKPIQPLDLYNTKFVNPKDLVSRNFKLVATNGCYDLLTEAHVSTFEFAKSKGDKLVVLINSDESVRRLKGETRPVVPLEQRKKIIASLECVDYVIDFSEDSPYNLISEIAPDVLVKGGDIGKVPRSASLVKEFYFAPLVEGISTTNIIKKINR